MKQGVAELSNSELWIYLFSWATGLFYGLYQIYLQTSAYFDNYDNKLELATGWGWIGRRLDIADLENLAFIPLIYESFPWICVHFLGGQIIKYFFNCTSLLCCWFAFISLAYQLFYFGLPTVIFLLAMPVVTCLLVPFRSKILLWTVQLSALLLFGTYGKFEDSWRNRLAVNWQQYYVVVVVFAWNQLRSLSFGLDSIDKYKHVKINGFFKDLLEILAFCLYLPTYFLGQMILFGEFVEGIRRPFETWTFKRAATTVFDLLRFFFWIKLSEFVLHFVYITTLRAHIQLIRGLDNWACYPFGFWMGLHFFTKYVIFYGISSVIPRAENIVDLPTPRCIARIHLYSDMWKYFDRGLYKFLVRYIYLPSGGAKSALQKFVSSILCFSFIYLWHGIARFIFIWSALNWAGVTIESVAKGIASSKTYVRFEEKYLGPQNTRRFRCLLASPLFIMSAISNFYFFGGEEVGYHFIDRILNDSWKSIMILIFFVYCLCQVSTEFENRDIRKCQRIKSVNKSN